MRVRLAQRWSGVGVAVVLVGLLAWPIGAGAQTLSGQAVAVQATVVGPLGSTTTVLADTGPLGGPDTLQASALTGDVPWLLTGGVLHATTLGWSGSGDGQVNSEAALADLALSVAGTSIGADFVMARAFVGLGTASLGISNIDNLSINGVPISVSGDPNETIFIPGGLVVINEQQGSPTGTVVNALHVTVYGVADVIIGSATAGIQ